MAKSIAVLTSGGDAPGMNAAVRSVVRAAMYRGMKVIGVYRGYNGLLNKDVKELDLRSVSDVINRGGTVLYTARSEKFKTPEGIEQAAQNCRELGIDGLVVIGGDGSFRGARKLSLAGIPCVGIQAPVNPCAFVSDEHNWTVHAFWTIEKVYEQHKALWQAAGYAPNTGAKVGIAF
ncbi:MAG: 6-phosphofructokinase, partial [Ruminococcus sp.]|nr:6-phosphofructokinase [Ruminococcus sp.]